MKKIILTVAAIIMSASLIGCGSTENTTTEKEPAPTAATAVQKPDSETEKGEPASSPEVPKKSDTSSDKTE